MEVLEGERKMSDLTKKKCVPCEGGVPPLSESQAQMLLSSVPGWNLEGKKITKEYTFQNFRESMKFVNRVAELAEEEGHHPDIHIYYRRVRLDIFTHAIGGLSENDFILAAKIEEIAR